MVFFCSEIPSFLSLSSSFHQPFKASFYDVDKGWHIIWDKDWWVFLLICKGMVCSITLMSTNRSSLLHKYKVILIIHWQTASIAASVSINHQQVSGCYLSCNSMEERKVSCVIFIGLLSQVMSALLWGTSLCIRLPGILGLDDLCFLKNVELSDSWGVWSWRS